MWFLAHCYEDQGKISDAIDICEQVTELLRSFGGAGLGQQHKLWLYVAKKRSELWNLKERNEKHGIASDRSIVHPIYSPPHTPRKKIIRDMTL